MRNKIGYLIITYFLFFWNPVFSQNVGSISGSNITPQYTREIPESRGGWMLNSFSMSATDVKITTDRMMYIGEQRFFSIWVYVESSGTPDIDVFLLGSFDNNSDHLAEDLAGTYQILDDFTRKGEWVFTYVSPSPCSYVALKVVCNSGSADCKVSAVFYKTGS